MQAPDLQYWDAQSSIGSTFHRLKNVKLTDVSGVLHEMKFIEFLLDRGRLTMLVDLVGFRRASPRASINFIHEPV
ncbi:hypothetical protein OROHE_027539 [Orobanche hederae]